MQLGRGGCWSNARLLGGEGWIRLSFGGFVVGELRWLWHRRYFQSPPRGRLGLEVNRFAYLTQVSYFHFVHLSLSLSPLF